MAETIITIKQAKLVEKGDNKWVELIDQDDKTHRVFKSIQNNAGEWVHFDDQLNDLVNSEGQTFKLTKERKGNFWNVIAIEPVENVSSKKGIEKVRSEPSGQEVGLWWKEVGELYRMWKIHPETKPAKPWAKALVMNYLAQMFSVTGIKVEEES